MCVCALGFRVWGSGVRVWVLRLCRLIFEALQASHFLFPQGRTLFIIVKAVCWAKFHVWGLYKVGLTFGAHVVEVLQGLEIHFQGLGFGEVSH